MLKGTIIENSLQDKSLLKKVKITRTWKSGDWIFHAPKLGGTVAAWISLTNETNETF